MKRISGTMYSGAVLAFGLLWPSATAHANPPALCQYQLGDKIVTVACGTCEDLLAEPGMAGNVACLASPPAAPVQPQPPQTPTPLSPDPGAGSSPNSPGRPFFEALDAAQILQLGSVYSPEVLGAANHACADRDNGRNLGRITASVAQGLRARGLDWVTDDVSGGIVRIAFTQLCPR
jgi:hypothetical protein